MIWNSDGDNIINSIEWARESLDRVEELINENEKNGLDWDEESELDDELVSAKAYIQGALNCLVWRRENRDRDREFQFRSKAKGESVEDYYDAMCDALARSFKATMKKHMGAK